MFVTLFGLTSHECSDAPDASWLAEDLVLSMIERCKGYGVDAGDVASLLALELIASIAAYDRAPLSVILAAIAEAAPTREALVRDANQRGERPPPLNVAGRPRSLPMRAGYTELNRRRLTANTGHLVLRRSGGPSPFP